MKIRQTLLLSLLLAASPTLFAAAICEVIAVRGDARLGNNGPALSLGQKLEAGSDIRTGTSGRVRLRFEDGSTVVIGDNSQLLIERFEHSNNKAREASLSLESGLIGQQVSRQEGGKWIVRTPSAVTAVRGTEFFVEVGQDFTTAVSVQSGAVDVEALESAAGGNLRRLHPPSKVSLSQARDGTDCKPGIGCSPVKTWGDARHQALLDRLNF